MPRTKKSIPNLPQSPEKLVIIKEEKEIDSSVVMIMNQNDTPMIKEEPEEQFEIITYKTDDKQLNSNENSDENSEDCSENSGNSNQNYENEERNFLGVKIHQIYENSSDSNSHQNSEIKVEKVEGSPPLKMTIFGLNSSNLESRISSNLKSGSASSLKPKNDSNASNLKSKTASSLKSGVASSLSSKTASKTASDSTSNSSSKTASSLKLKNDASLKSGIASNSAPKTASSLKSGIASNSTPESVQQQAGGIKRNIDDESAKSNPKKKKIESSSSSQEESKNSKKAKSKSIKIKLGKSQKTSSKNDEKNPKNSSKVDKFPLKVFEMQSPEKKSPLKVKQESVHQSAVNFEDLIDSFKTEDSAIETENNPDIINYIPTIKKKRKIILLSCDHCGKTFKSKYSILWHMKDHMVTMPFNCEKCGKGFTYMRSYQQHILTHAEKVKCEICSKKLKPHAMYYHMKFRHSDEKNFKCPECPKYFKTRDNITRHIMRHKMEFTCNLCARKFAENSRLIQHIKMHENPENFYCKLCDKHFEHIDRHVKRVHIKKRERNYKCKYCGYATDIKQSIVRHEEMHEKRSEQMKLNAAKRGKTKKVNPLELIKCEICELMLQTKQGFKSHMRHYHGKGNSDKTKVLPITNDEEVERSANKIRIKEEKKEEHEDVVAEQFDQSKITIKQEIISENY